MSSMSDSQIEERRTREREGQQESHVETSSESGQLDGSANGLLLQSGRGMSGMRGRGNAPVRAAGMQSTQRAYGNRAVQRFMSRQSAEGDREYKPVQRFGWQRPQGDDSGGYAYFNQNKSGWGIDYGLGGSIPGWGIDMPSINGSIGLMEDDKGNTRFGATTSGGIFKSDHNGDGVPVDWGIGTFSGGSSIGTNGASFGGQANFGEINGSYGKLNPNSSNDTTLRGGLSAGAGLGFRGHWSDDDKDGNREYGLGFDMGPVSFDFKSEDPSMAAGAVFGPLGHLSGLLPSPFGAVSDDELPKVPGPADGGVSVQPVGPSSSGAAPNQSGPEGSLMSDPTGQFSQYLGNSISGMGSSAPDWLGDW